MKKLLVVVLFLGACSQNMDNIKRLCDGLGAGCKVVEPACEAGAIGPNDCKNARQGCAIADANCDLLLSGDEN